MDCKAHGVTKSWTRLSDFHFHLYLNIFYFVASLPSIWDLSSLTKSQTQDPCIGSTES